MPQTVTIDGFGGGVNQRVPAVDIADNELVDAKNVYLDGNRTLVTRPGLTSISASYTFGGEDVIGLFYFETSDGSVKKVIACTKDGIHETTAGLDTWADITPSVLTLTGTAQRWEFAVLNDILILSNMQDPLMTWDGDSGVTVVEEMAYSGATDPGNPLSLAVMDNRLFFVDASSPNTLRWSALGNPIDFDTTGVTGSGSWNVGGAEGDSIVRIYPHRGRLFIFKNKSVYHLVPGGPREDTAQWQVPQLLKNVGLAAPDSCQVVRDDLVFLSHTGLLSIGATAQYGDWKQAELSVNIPSLRNWAKAKPYLVRSIVHPNLQQYLISIPTGSATVPDETWVMDFTQTPAWTRYTGGMAAQAFAIVLESSVPKLYVGNDIVTYESETWQDNGVSYEKLVQTKSYSLGETLLRKIFHRFGVQFEALTDPLSVEILYRLDQDPFKTKTIDYSFAGLLTGAIWDVDLWDTGLWSTELTDLTDLIYRIQGGPGRRAQVIDFRYRNDAAEAFALKRMSLDVTLLPTHKMVSE